MQLMSPLKVWLFLEHFNLIQKHQMWFINWFVEAWLFSCTSVIYCTVYNVHSKWFPQGACMNTSENLQCQPMLWQTTNIWTHVTYKFMPCFLPRLSYPTHYQFEYIRKLAMSFAGVLTNKEAVIEKKSTSVDNLARLQRTGSFGDSLEKKTRTFWDPVQNQGIIGVHWAQSKLLTNFVQKELISIVGQVLLKVSWLL